MSRRDELFAEAAGCWPPTVLQKNRFARQRELHLFQKHFAR